MECKCSNKRQIKNISNHSSEVVQRDQFRYSGSIINDNGKIEEDATLN